MKPYYEADGVTIYHGDCRGLLDELSAGVQVAIVDPPYGDTSLDWDTVVEGWVGLVAVPQVWCFGSLRFWLAQGAAFEAAGWKYAQELVWEKHNGSSFHADRFRRVHELIVHWYRGDWGSLYHEPPKTADATARTIRRKKRPPHTGHIEKSAYVSEDGGPRLQRSVIPVRSCHGHAQHPTQKPVGIVGPLVENSSQPGDLVLDPFMGSGSTLVAAKELGRRAVGIEIEEQYCEVAARRLDQQVLALG